MTIPTNNKKKANYPLFTMNKRRTILLTVCAMLLAASCQQKGTMVVKTDADAQLKSENDSISWAMGNILGQNVLASGIEIDRQLLVQSLLATLDDNNKLLNEEQIVAMQQRIEEKFYASQNERYKSTMEDVRKQEEVYFSQLTAQNPNVKKSDKGFYYEVLKEGDGRKGELGLLVEFDYKGTFTNGQIFDQTYGNRPPIVHMIDEGLMPGLREAFCMMKAGSKYRFYFPSEMAFGAQGSEDIPPFTTVIYEVELHDVHE